MPCQGRQGIGCVGVCRVGATRTQAGCCRNASILGGPLRSLRRTSTLLSTSSFSILVEFFASQQLIRQMDADAPTGLGHPRCYGEQIGMHLLQ
ncbi:MAG: hypothetical protein C4335_07725 [Armatimonadota bacterium]